jgi:sugar phosphate isomerase/epimerase
MITRNTRKPITRIASPLYILRHDCEKDLFSVLERIKEMGYDGVEFLGFFGKNPRELQDKLKELGLTAVGNHVDYDEFLKDINTTIQTHKEIGCNYITINGLPKEKLFDGNALSEYITNTTKIGLACREQGITLLYHNHDRELMKISGEKYVLEEILDRIPEESIAYEPDLGWIAIGGALPEYFLDKYKKRCPIIHLKDFYADDITKIGDIHELDTQKGDAAHSFFEFRPTGYGIANIPAFMKKVMLCNPEWIVADHDLAYERDSYYDLKISLEYIKNLLILA